MKNKTVFLLFNGYAVREGDKWNLHFLGKYPAEIDSDHWVGPMRSQPSTHHADAFQKVIVQYHNLLRRDRLSKGSVPLIRMVVLPKSQSCNAAGKIKSLDSDFRRFLRTIKPFSLTDYSVAVRCC